MAGSDPSSSPPERSPADWETSTLIWVGATGLLLVLLYWHVGGVFAARWFGKSTFYHCLAVPPLVVWLVRQRRRQLEDLSPRPSIAGIGLLGIGLLIVVLGSRLGINLLIGASFPIVIAGLVLLLWGWERLRVLTMPLLVLFFAIPPPEHALAVITMPMQRLSAFVTEHVAQTALGIPVIREGINLILHGHKFVVAEQCSGMSSFLALSLTVVFLIELSGLTSGRKVIALASLPPIVICANVVRLCLVLLTAQYFGPQIAMGKLVHGITDAAVYLSALVMVIMFLSALLPREEYDEAIEEPPENTPHGDVIGTFEETA